MTEGPRLFYVDPDQMVLKGEIPWNETIRPEARDFKIFFVHTPGRVYYLIDPGKKCFSPCVFRKSLGNIFFAESRAKDWCHAIQEVRNFYYGDN